MTLSSNTVDETPLYAGNPLEKQIPTINGNIIDRANSNVFDMVKILFIGQSAGKHS